jgi:hypothetical protein
LFSIIAIAIYLKLEGVIITPGVAWGGGMLFGAQSKQNAIQVVLNQIQKIHPEIVEYFEVQSCQV